MAAGTWLSRWKKDRGSILKSNFSMQTSSSIWPLHLSNTRTDAAPPTLSHILSKYSPVSCYQLFSGVQYQINKFDVDIFSSLYKTIEPNSPLDYYNTRNNGSANFCAALMVIWIVYQCVVLFLPITVTSIVFEPRIYSVRLDTIS